MSRLVSNVLGQSELSVEALLATYGIETEQLDRITHFGRIVIPRLDEFISLFYAWMETTPEFRQFFSNPEKLQEIQALQREYWRDFFNAEIDEEYFETRRTVGDRHARIGLSLPAYFAGMNEALTIFVDKLYDDSLSDEEYAKTIRAITKLIHLDTSLTINSFTQRTNRVIADQHRSLLEMSTPVTSIWDDILMLPIVGIIDSKRAQDIMHAMLNKIAETRAKAIILDISGVGVVDTAVANHLIKITKATKLMGCECTVSGVSPAIAQTIVELGIDVGTMKTTATLRDALADAFHNTGHHIQRRPKA